MFETVPFEIICGDAKDIVSTLPQVDCVCTSPPYFKQRVYGKDNRELGQEREVDQFVSALVGVFEAVPLAPWGSMWINIGNKRGKKGELLGVTAKFVVAMMNTGYYLMDDVVWAKEIVKVDGECIGHCMVEPAPGRLNGNGWEPFYHFVKDPNLAWSDTCAVRIPRDNCPEVHRYRPASLMQIETMEGGRNCANVWSVGTSRKGKAHFAAFPAALVERPIAMTCPEWVTEKGPRERLTVSTEYDEKRGSKRVFGQYTTIEKALKNHYEEDAASLTSEERQVAEALRKDENSWTTQERGIVDSWRKKSGRMDTGRVYTPKYPKTIGWTLADLPSRPGVVLDPFGGTGTTGEVAVKLGRRFIGIDLYQKEADRMSKRCADAVEVFKAHQPEPQIVVTESGDVQAEGMAF